MKSGKIKFVVGTVTAVGGGTCYITAKTTDGLSASCKVNADSSSKYYTLSPN